MKRALLCMCALVVSLIPGSAAYAAPAIELLHPSPLSAQTPQPEISDKSDLDQAVHLTAWVQEVPGSPLVEFELAPPAGGTITIDAQRVGSTDTWEAFFTIPDGFMDGAYTIIARLFSGQQEVDDDSQIVTINSDVPPPEGETVEITYPDNGGEIGFHTPAGGRAVVVVEGTTSADARRVRALYTTSDPGQPPEWSSCGNGSPSMNAVRIRCTLAENTPSADVTAIALVTNSTPSPATPDPLADDSGDAHRVLPYAQVPTIIDVDPETISQDPGNCQLLTATVIDQRGRAIVTANVDVHAVEPNDQLRFATLDTSPVTEDTSDFQGPDKGHISSENTVLCSDGSTNEDRKQGDHNIPANPDVKHIESVAGTDNSGAFAFALRSDSIGPTHIEVWADVNDDDVAQASEATGGARIGWGQAPPPPKRTLNLDPQNSTADSGSCRAITVIARQGGNALANANVDLHITGPDAEVAFCDTPDAGLDRPPDQGGHTGDTHPEDGTRHAEGETSTNGQFVFGVTSATAGTTQLLAWLDSTDDDLLFQGEISQAGSITWQGSGKRRITIERSDGRVESGKKVTISGEIKGDAGCIADQTVKLKARPANSSKRFKNIDTRRTDDEGDYKFKPVVNQSRDYRTVAPKDGVCRKAKSKTVTVRAT